MFCSYQKTSAAAKSAAEKTSTVVAGIGTTVSKKLGDLRSVHQKVGEYVIIKSQMKKKINTTY